MHVGVLHRQGVNEPALERSATGRRRYETAVTLGLLVAAWAGWSVSHSLRLHGRGVPIDWIGLASAWSGLALVIIGLTAWAMRNNTRAGLLIAVCGVLFLFPSLQSLREPVVWTLASALSPAYVPVLGFLVLAFAAGRASGPAVGLVMTALVVDALAWGPGNLPFALPQDYGCAGCPESTNLAYLHGQESLGWTFVQWYTRLGLVAWGLLLVILVWRFIVASAAARRVLAPVYLAVAVFALAQEEVQTLILLREWPLFDPSQFASAAVILLLPIGFAFGLLRARGRRWRVGDLALELEDVHEPQRLEGAIRRALGDPSAELGTWSRVDDCYVAHGHALALPEPGGQRTAAFIDHDHEPMPSSCTTQRSPTTNGLSRALPRPHGWRSLMSASPRRYSSDSTRSSPRGRASSLPPTRNGNASSATSTTAPSSAS
jgi:hypothetical protein